MVFAFPQLAVAFLAGGSDDEALRRTDAVVVGDDLVATSCRGVGAGAPELGNTTFRYGYRMAGENRPGSDHYVGRVTFSLGEIVVRVPKSISWANMTDRDHAEVEALRRAILHHEVGHVRVAESVRDALNAQPPIEAPDPFAFEAAADAAGRAGFERFRREEREYDDLTAHGRRQYAAPGVLAGPNTTLLCS